MRKIEFLYESLADAQAIIRAIDVKLGFLFAIAAIPLVGAGGILCTTKEMAAYSPFFAVVAGVIALLWFLSIYTLFMGLSPLSNPASVVLDNRDSGLFYGGGVVSLSFADVFLNRKLKSNKSLQEITELLPCDDEKIIQDLVFEKIKLSYIRDIKMKRSSWCVRLSLSWILLSSFAYLIYFFVVV